MPRFLHTYTGEFHWVADPSEIMYAILSHTWQPEELGGEQSYASILELQAQAERTSKGHAGLYIHGLTDTNAHPGSIFFNDGLSDKIKNACRIAREAGYQLIWIDSGCIDKSSSAELAEAINSMFELYKLADVCFAYLADVPDDEDPRDEISMFRKSRWHERGWTLQELIAPKNVVFLTQTWKLLGTKTGLASILEQVTRVDGDILIGRAPVDSASVARRMSWAATRKTTRVEDEAYSLLGIFGVHLSPIYGEGRNAFLRLQEEILKHIPDQTILAWGNSHMEMGPLRDLTHFPGDSSSLSRQEGRSLEVRWTSRGGSDPDHWRGLLAPSPMSFQNAHDISSLLPTEFASRLHLAGSGVTVPPLRYVFTPQGVVLTLLAVRCAKGSPSNWIARDFDSVRDNHTKYTWKDCAHGEGVAEYLALLQCEATSSIGRAVIAIALLRPPLEMEQNTGLHVATRACGCNDFLSSRLVYISPSALNALRRHLVPTELNLRRDALPTPSPSVIDPSRRVCLWPDLCTAFYVAPWCEERLGAIGVTFSPLQVQVDEEKKYRIQTILTSSPTSHNPPESEAAQCAFGAIEITLSLTPQLEALMGWMETTFAVCRFSVKNSFRDASQSPIRRGAEDVRFDTSYIPAALHQRVIHETVFEVQQELFDAEEDQSQQLPGRTPTLSGRRILRVSLECPPHFLYPSRPSERSGSIIIPYLWISIELSDVLQSVQSPNASEVAISPSPTTSASSAHPSRARPYGIDNIYEYDCGFGNLYYEFLQDIQPLPEPTPTSVGIRGRLGPLKRFLDDVGLQVLRQPKKLVENIVARRRKAEGSPPRSHASFSPSHTS